MYKYTIIMDHGGHIDVTDNYDITKIINDNTRFLKLKYNSIIINMDHVSAIFCEEKEKEHKVYVS